MENIGYIYCIINTVNQKIYIGQTTRDLKERMKDHVKKAYRYPDTKQELYKDIRKYSVYSFSIYLLESCEEKDLNKKEREWIKYFRKRKPELLYNIRNGGGVTRKKKYDIEQIILEIGRMEKSKNMTPLKIAKKFGFSKQEIKILLKTFGFDEVE